MTTPSPESVNEPVPHPSIAEIIDQMDCTERGANLYNATESHNFAFYRELAPDCYLEITFYRENYPAFYMGTYCGTKAELRAKIESEHEGWFALKNNIGAASCSSGYIINEED